MVSTLKTSFYLRKPKNHSGGEIPVYLRITVDEIPTEISTGVNCLPSKWIARKGRLKSTDSTSQQLNDILDKLELKAKDNYRYLLEVDPTRLVTAQDIKHLVTGKKIQRIMLLDIFQEHNNKVQALVGEHFAEGTLERYKTTYKHTADFIKMKYKVDDLAITRVNHEFIYEFDFYLRSTRMCNNNTTIKYLKNFKKIILLTIASGFINTNPFLNYKPKLKAVDRTALTKEELASMQKKTFSVERLEAVKDAFLFCCYTGLAYADVSALNRTNILKGIDGEMWIHTFRKKTSTPTKVPLLKPALALIKKYKDHPKCEELVFPLISNQKMNAYLKEIAIVCRIKKDLTFHLARHTFATTVTLSNGVPIDTVSKMLGHTNIRTTQLYAKTLELKIGNDMADLKKKLNI